MKKGYSLIKWYDLILKIMLISIIFCYIVCFVASINSRVNSDFDINKVFILDKFIEFTKSSFGIIFTATILTLLIGFYLLINFLVSKDKIIENINCDFEVMLTKKFYKVMRKTKLTKIYQRLKK